MRGGIATISHRHARANNPLVEGYDPQNPPPGCRTQTVIICTGGGAMCQPLPVGNFRFLSQEEIAGFDLMSVPSHGDTGYIVECDLKYPPELHDLHSDYPMAPEHLTVSPDMLSDFCREIKAENWKPMQKLVPNLFDKTNYVCHYRTYNSISNTVSS